MNEYGVIAQRHWIQFLPSRSAAIPDQERFFTTLGLEVAEEIDQLSIELAGDDPTEETYLEKVGRLEAARRQAREKVLTERVYLPAEPGSPMDEEPTSPPLTSTMSTGWISTVEDPTDPWWIDQRLDDR